MIDSLSGTRLMAWALALAVFITLGSFPTTSGDAPPADWVRTARIMPRMWWDLTWEQAVDRAVSNGANVILDWVGLSDTYPNRINPVADLETMQAAADYVHSRHPGVRLIYYVGGLEMQTPDSDMDNDGRDDDGRGSVWTDHPDWVQVGIDGTPAVFYGGYSPGMPFWVPDRAEDVWLTPAAPGFMELMTGLAARIAETGVDGVWLDVPFLLSDFGDEWQDQWASADEYSRALFEAETGYPFPDEADWDDPAWAAYIRWRYGQTERYVGAFNAAMKMVNPEAQLIVETSVIDGVSRIRTASDLWALPEISDATAHEIGAGVGDDGPPEVIGEYQWLRFLAQLLYARATDRGQPGWLLSYVHQGRADLLRLHSAVALTAGMNYYVSGGEGMTDLVDEEAQAAIFNWLANVDSVYYDASIEPYCRVLLADSRTAIDYLDRGSWEDETAYPELIGIAEMLLQLHVPFCFAEESELGDLWPHQTLILPNVGPMDDTTAEAIREFVRAGGTLLSTAETSLYDGIGRLRDDFALADVFGVHAEDMWDRDLVVNRYGAGVSYYTPRWMGGDFEGAAATWDIYPDRPGAESVLADMADMLDAVGFETRVTVEASPWVIVLPFEYGNSWEFRILNLAGVGVNSTTPTPQTVTVTVSLIPDQPLNEVLYLPYMGEWTPVEYKVGDGGVSFTVQVGLHGVVVIR